LYLFTKHDCTILKEAQVVHMVRGGAGGAHGAGGAGWRG